MAYLKLWKRRLIGEINKEIDYRKDTGSAKENKCNVVRKGCTEPKWA